MDAMKALVNVNSRASDVFYCYQINFDKKLHIWKKKKKIAERPNQDCMFEVSIC